MVVDELDVLGSGGAPPKADPVLIVHANFVVPRPIDADAVPIDAFLGSSVGPLPEWYMPPVTARRVRGLPRVAILTVVGAFLAIEAAGLCNTYGQLLPFH